MIYLGDGPTGLASLEPGSVDLVLTDPPSGDTEAEFDVPADLDAFWPAVWRALKPTGVAVVMASSFRFADELYHSARDAFRYDQIWEKNLPTGFLNRHTRPLRNHEFVLTFWKQPGTYHPQMSTGYEPISSNRKRREPKATNLSKGENYGRLCRSTPSRVGETDRFPKSVLYFPGVSTADPERCHPQQKPEGLLAYFVRTYSNPGDIVADPYSGSGSTARAATTEGRRALGWDNRPEFVAIGNERPGLFGGVL